MGAENAGVSNRIAMTTRVQLRADAAWPYDEAVTRDAPFTGVRVARLQAMLQ